ncbi:MAG: hypothetical protein WCV67_15325 [Victivallaceae bacterium]
MAQEKTSAAGVALMISTDRIFYSEQAKLCLTSKLTATNTNLHGTTLRYNIRSVAGTSVLTEDSDKIFILSTVNIDIKCLPYGNYVLEVSLLSKDGTCLARNSTPFCKIPPLQAKIPRLVISEKGIPLLDKKPSLLRIVWLGGGWEGPIEKEELKSIAEQGFDSVIAGSVYMRTEALAHFAQYPERGKGGIRQIVERSKFRDFNQFLSALHEYRLTCFAHMGEITARFPELNINNLKDTGNFIFKYRDDPAILGWYSLDESDAWIETNRKIYNVIKEVDPYRPVWLNVISAVDANKNACDIISTDPYPIGKTKITLISSHMDNIVKSQYGVPGKTSWIILQMFGSPAEGWPRPPTPQEEKCITYLALNHGAQSLVYFAHQRLDTLTSSKKLTPELWNSMKSLNAETKEMSLPYLLGEDLKGIHANSASLDIAAKRYGKSIFLIAVNTLPETLDASIDLNIVKKEGKVAVKFESREVLIRGGILTDHFRPYDVHVYIIE